VKGLNLYLGPGGARYNFGIVARAHIMLPAGTYRFSATSDDGVRVSVDGQFVTGQWVGRPPRTDTSVVSLTGGEHEAKIDYFDLAQGLFLQLEVAPTDAVPSATTRATVLRR